NLHLRGKNSFYTYFSNCIFENVKFIGFIYYGDVTFDNCSFNDILGIETTYCSVLCSYNNGNTLNILDSKFENINVNINVPLIHLSNTYFNYMNEYKNISTLFDGHHNTISINNSSFTKINNKSLSPVILNSPISNVNFYNTKFTNIISFIKSFFNSEANYTFESIIMEDIKIRSGIMIDILYKSVSFKNCVFNNIICGGESDNSSLIRFISSDYGNYIDMKNINIKNCTSNGDLIIFDGRNSTITLSDSMINNSNFHNNMNINKLKCGLISNYNTIYLFLRNSTFYKNIVKHNGSSL
ncbi:hypothetical protein BCR36DRAFT_294937, partial [Piromyces finnis]